MKLIKTELYKLMTTKMFYILNAVIFGVNIVLNAFLPTVAKMVLPENMVPEIKLSEAVASPFSLDLMMIMVFISAASFLYIDFGNGYIKNIAGQLKNRGRMVFAKYIVIAVHNLIFFAVGVISNVIGSAASGYFRIDDQLAGAVETLLLKWLLSMAICALLMLIAMGMRSKSFAIIMAVLLGLNALSLLYLGLDTAINNVFGLSSVAIEHFMPDSLLITVNAITGLHIWNAIIVSAIWIAVCVTLSYITFKKRDIQ